MKLPRTSGLSSCRSAMTFGPLGGFGEFGNGSRGSGTASRRSGGGLWRASFAAVLAAGLRPSSGGFAGCHRSCGSLQRVRQQSLRQVLQWAAAAGFAAGLAARLTAGLDGVWRSWRVRVLGVLAILSEIDKRYNSLYRFPGLCKRSIPACRPCLRAGAL